MTQQAAKTDGVVAREAQNPVEAGAPGVARKPRSSEMHPGPGFRIRREVERPEPGLIAQLAEFETPDISDRMNRLYTMHPEIRAVTGRARIFGPACTVRVFPGDNLMVHKSLDVARPGDVVVVDAGASTMNAVLGDLVTAKARHRGLAGFVVDGLIRDLPGIERQGLPVFARGITPIGPLHRGPGEVNFPIQCGGIVVNPGDIIVGDPNGVVVVPRQIAPTLLRRLTEQKRAEAAYVAGVMKGQFSNEWVDRLLDEAGCEVADQDAPGRGEAER
jgi:RraA family protein